MSISEAERFVNDLASKPELLAQVRPVATGLAAVVALGRSHGYDFSLNDAKQYIQTRSPRELTDRQLDAIAGGKHHSSVATSTKVAQTTAVASSVVEVAEVATTAVQVTEAAADVAAAAEAVVVVAAVLI